MEYEAKDNKLYRKIEINKEQELQLIEQNIAMHTKNIEELQALKAELLNVK